MEEFVNQDCITPISIASENGGGIILLLYKS